MPIYEFVCEACGHEFEKIVSFSAQSHPVCPACAAQTVSRRLSKPAIHFKGSGWYITDSKSETKKGNGNSETKEPEKTESSSESGESAKSEPAVSTAESAPAKSDPAPKSEPAAKSEPSPKST